MSDIDLGAIRADLAEHERAHTLVNAGACGFCSRAPRYVAQLLREVERLQSRDRVREQAVADVVALMRSRVSDWHDALGPHAALALAGLADMVEQGASRD